MQCTFLGKGKKEDWPDEESDKELIMERESLSEDELAPVVKSKSKLFQYVFWGYSDSVEINQ